MNIKIIIVALITCCIYLACKSPLDTTPTNSENILQLKADYNQNKRILDTLIVKLSWSEITFENFKEIKITRFNEHRDPGSYPAGTTENGWITLATITDEFKTSLLDTVEDDAVFKYRVEFYNHDDNFKRAETTISIQPNYRINIPSDMSESRNAPVRPTSLWVTLRPRGAICS